MGVNQRSTKYIFSFILDLYKYSPMVLKNHSVKQVRYSNLNFRWWKDAQDSMPSELVEKREILYTATTGSSYGGPMKLINNIFNSDILFDLRREGDALQNGETGEASVSGRDFALVSSDMWLQALKWYVLFPLYISDGSF